MLCLANLALLRSFAAIIGVATARIAKSTALLRRRSFARPSAGGGLGELCLTRHASLISLRFSATSSSPATLPEPGPRVTSASRNSRVSSADRPMSEASSNVISHTSESDVNPNPARCPAQCVSPTASSHTLSGGSASSLGAAWCASHIAATSAMLSPQPKPPPRAPTGPLGPAPAKPSLLLLMQPNCMQAPSSSNSLRPPPPLLETLVGAGSMVPSEKVLAPACSSRPLSGGRMVMRDEKPSVVPARSSLLSHSSAVSCMPVEEGGGFGVLPRESRRCSLPTDPWLNLREDLPVRDGSGAPPLEGAYMVAPGGAMGLQDCSLVAAIFSFALRKTSQLLEVAGPTFSLLSRGVGVTAACLAKPRLDACSMSRGADSKRRYVAAKRLRKSLPAPFRNSARSAQSSSPRLTDRYAPVFIGMAISV
eukprot:scaffold88358_cov71-Phaeocystis_antarctica.AAC.6